VCLEITYTRPHTSKWLIDWFRPVWMFLVWFNFKHRHNNWHAVRGGYLYGNILFIGLRYVRKKSDDWVNRDYWKFNCEIADFFQIFLKYLVIIINCMYHYRCTGRSTRSYEHCSQPILSGPCSKHARPRCIAPVDSTFQQFQERYVSNLQSCIALDLCTGAYSKRLPIHPLSK
jgi:hypothetical protein